MMRATGEPARIFVSHSHDDNVWCRAFVTALTRAGADVWYDERNIGPGRLDDEIEPALRARSIFIVVLSPAAVASQWVQREVTVALRLQDADATRIFLPVLAAACDIPDDWSAYWRLTAPRDKPLLPLQAATRTVQIVNERHRTALHTEAQPAITDLYEAAHQKFLIHIPRVAVVAACLTGVAVLLVTGFLGYYDSASADVHSPYYEQPFTRTLFRQPWPLYLWLCALLLALQTAILRHPSLRARRVVTLVITTFCIIGVGVSYSYNKGIQQFLQNLLTQTFFKVSIPEQGNNPWTFTLLNYTIIVVVWLSMLYRWSRRTRHLPVRLAVNIGLEETMDVAAAEPDLPRLIGGDLVVLSVVVSVLAIVFRAEVLNALANAANINVQISTCSVTLPSTPCVDPGDPSGHTTLAFLDVVQALVYFPVGFGLLVSWALTHRLRGKVERDDVLERLRNALLDFLVAVRDAFVRWVPRILGPTLALRILIWVPLILFSVVAAAALSRDVQFYLHLLSDSRTCATTACPDYQNVQALLASGQQYQPVAVALLWGIVSAVTIVLSLAIQLLRWRIASNTTRFMRRLALVVIPWLWVIPLVLSAANAIAVVTHLSRREPFPQPELVTIVLLAASALSVASDVSRRVRAGRQARA